MKRGMDLCQCGAEKARRAQRCRTCFLADRKPLGQATCNTCDGVFGQRSTESAAEFAARRFCSRQCSAQATPRTDPSVRFWRRVVRGDESECWQWTGALVDGYAHFWGGPDRGYVRGHRFAYEELVGPIPDGLVIDHLCRVRRCVNPAHLEPVTDRENILRGEAPSAIAQRTLLCKRGHPLAGPGADVYITPAGTRSCRACARIRDAAFGWMKWDAAQKAKAA